MAVGDARRGDGALRAERDLRIAALDDVHGMLAALEAVLDEPSSAWVLLDDGDVELRRTPLDLDAAGAALRSVGAENWVAELTRLARA